MKEPVCYELIKRTTKKMMMKEDFSYLWVDQVYHFWGEARKIDQNLEGRDCKIGAKFYEISQIKKVSKGG